MSTAQLHLSRPSPGAPTVVNDNWSLQVNLEVATVRLANRESPLNSEIGRLANLTGKNSKCSESMSFDSNRWSQQALELGPKEPIKALVLQAL